MGLYTLPFTPDWVTSDHHFGSTTIRDLEPWRQAWCKRSADMNAILIEAWNSRIAPTDYVLHLGDFSQSPFNALKRFVSALNGTIIVARGNHDNAKGVFLAAGIYDVVARRDICIDYKGLRIVARHDPQGFPPFKPTVFDVYLHGHCHGRKPRWKRPPHTRSCDVGIDAQRSPYPLSFADTIDCAH